MAYIVIAYIVAAYIPMAVRRRVPGLEGEVKAAKELLLVLILPQVGAHDMPHSDKEEDRQDERDGDCTDKACCVQHPPLPAAEAHLPHNDPYT